MSKLTPCEIQLLRECCEYSIMDNMVQKHYYRLGGHGEVPMRYSYKRMPKLENLGLVIKGGGYEATEAGRALLSQLPQQKEKGMK